MAGRTRYPVKDALEVSQRVIDVEMSLRGAPWYEEGTRVPLIAEVVTSDPYTNTRAVVTAVGFVGEKVLLTVEPSEHNDRGERLRILARILNRVANVEGEKAAYALAGALLDAGVIPTRDY